MHTQKTILVVEDERSLRETVIDILHLKNFQSLEAKNGKDGVRIALLEHPDLILLDLIMPEMDGATALKQIRKDSWGKKVPIIVLTNLSTTNEQAGDLETQKLTQYLIKSDWKLHDIIKKIEQMLEV